MKEQPFEVIGVEALMECIQNCHVTLEESRRRLSPLVGLLDGRVDANDDDDDDDDEDNAVGGTKKSADVTLPLNNLNTFTDRQIVHEFVQCMEGSFDSVGALMVRLADAGLVSLDRDSGGGDRKDKKDRNGNNVHGDLSEEKEEDVYLLMASNCVSKVASFVTHHFLLIAEADSVSTAGPIDDRTNGRDHDQDHDHDEIDVGIQPRMARMAELALMTIDSRSLLPPSPSQEEATGPSAIMDAYAQYQRRCLRTRSKPAISTLAELRREAAVQKRWVSDLLDEGTHRHRQEEEEGGGGLEDAGAVERGQPHAQAITVILGEASSLIQPLAEWRDALQEVDGVSALMRRLCHEAMTTLDAEAQSLAVTVGTWFPTDQRGIVLLEQDDNCHRGTTYPPEVNLLSLEAALEEMAFLCQVLSRYCLFSRIHVSGNDKSNSHHSDDHKLQNLLTEQSLRYSMLETRLATLQFQQALSMASPQLIELGRPSLKVPSVVEDAHYLCVRAIERAAGTRSERAVWTVGHWVCEIWGVGGAGMDTFEDRGTEGVNGVYQALMAGVGCTGGETTELSERPGAISGAGPVLNGGTPPVRENSFTATLLEAVDDEIGNNGSGSSHPVSTPSSAPTSTGSVSSAIWDKIGRGSKLSKANGSASPSNQKHLLQLKIDAELCALNGISAAENACSALSALFADLVEERLGDEAASSPTGANSGSNSASMLISARDELATHSRAYHHLLQQRVRSLISEWCGADDIFDCDGRLCLQNLRLFLELEIYNLDAASFRNVESEDRLDEKMIAPLRRSQVFQEVANDKCDPSVVLQMAEAMSWKSAEIILQILFRGDKSFNDWGAMLLSKQVRLLQNTYCGLVLGVPDRDTGTKSNKAPTTKFGTTINTSSILTQFERVNQAVSILQLEKPSDWLAFAYRVGESDETNLKPDEIRKIMNLRVDFLKEAIAKVYEQIKS